jgi:hypothetical protein
LKEIRDANDEMTFFEFVGHCAVVDENTGPGMGLIIGDDVFGVGKTDTQGNGTWYGINDYKDLLAAVFDPCNAVIEIEGCYSAKGPTSIAYAFNEVLPNASVWGYTGKCQPWPFLWETHEDWIDDPNSQWVEVIL